MPCISWHQYFIPLSSSIESACIALDDTQLTHAQRAFRQRKEIHIKQLETKVGELDPLKRQLHALQADNYALRGYLITMLEQYATKGYEIPPGMPSMQNLQSGPPPPAPLESPTEDQHVMDQDPASAQLHAQQASYQGDSEMGGTGQSGSVDAGDGSGAPTASTLR